MKTDMKLATVAVHGGSRTENADGAAVQVLPESCTLFLTREVISQPTPCPLAAYLSDHHLPYWWGRCSLHTLLQQSQSAGMVQSGTERGRPSMS